MEKIKKRTGSFHLGRAGRQRLHFYLFLLPAVIGFSILTAYPFFSSLIASFTDRLLYYPGDAQFIGLKNYRICWNFIRNFGRRLKIL